MNDSVLNELFCLWCNEGSYEPRKEELDALDRIRTYAEGEAIMEDIYNYVLVMQKRAYQEGFKRGFHLASEIIK
ncbi:MAG: hypothetical protein LUG60_12965 [Erysipelotrichaceae bacterium]|nr:hypothetical protein [Erysipelotrichaceae bacterium]